MGLECTDVAEHDEFALGPAQRDIDQPTSQGALQQSARHPERRCVDDVEHDGRRLGALHAMDRADGDPIAELQITNEGGHQMNLTAVRSEERRLDQRFAAPPG